MGIVSCVRGCCIVGGSVNGGFGYVVELLWHYLLHLTLTSV